MKRYTLAELQNMKTIETGQFSDLKVQTDKVRVWLSRCTIADGEPYDHKVTVEEYRNGQCGKG